MVNTLTIPQLLCHLLTADYKGSGFKRQCLIELLTRSLNDDRVFMEAGNLSLEEVHDLLRQRRARGPEEVSERGA